MSIIEFMLRAQLVILAIISFLVIVKHFGLRNALLFAIFLGITYFVVKKLPNTVKYFTKKVVGESDEYVVDTPKETIDFDGSEIELKEIEPKIKEKIRQ